MYNQIVFVYLFIFEKKNYKAKKKKDCIFPFPFNIKPRNLMWHTLYELEEKKIINHIYQDRYVKKKEIPAKGLKEH